MSGQVIGRRNNRNPGHCWQDNELHDVFRPLIGALAAHVFAVMTRWCYGHEVRIGLRELAEEAGVSRSTAHRATLAMAAVDMIRIVEGRGRGSAAYELLDLKEAARALGAQWDRGRASYALNRGQVQALRKRVAESLCVSVRDTKQPRSEGACVPVRDANGCGKPSVASQLVSQNEGVCVPNQGAPSITQRHKDIKAKPTPVSPPASGTGKIARVAHCGEAQVSTDAFHVKLAAATEKLCNECDVADDRQRRKLAKAIAQYAAKERMSPDEAATAMVGGWREWRAYCAARPGLRFRWGPIKFFTLGHWRNSGNWPDVGAVEMAKLQMEREARVGMQ